MADRQLQSPQHEEVLVCPVCVDLIQEPVTISCGHSYCRGCIQDYWDHEEQAEDRGEVSCPMCRETFGLRPELRRNNMLAQVVEQVKRSSLHEAPPPAPHDAATAAAAPADVFCDFCPEPNKAAVSCLTCLASYCAAHVAPHRTAGVLRRHQLVTASVPLQDKICGTHNKLMDVFCVTERRLVCSLCTVDQHKHHELEAVSAQRAKMETLRVSSQRRVQQSVQQRELELQELSQAEGNIKSGALSAQRDCDQLFAGMIALLRRRRGEVRRLIAAQEKMAAEQVEGSRRQLEAELTGLRRRDGELERLSRADDHVHFIQMFESLASDCDSELSCGAVPLRSFEDVTECVSRLGDQLETLLQEAWPKISTTASYVDFTLPAAPSTREQFLRYSRRLTLDESSSYPHLTLICDSRRVKPWLSPAPPHASRFTRFPQVLCTQALCQRSYWEVEWRARGLSAAVARADIGRADADASRFGKSDRSWSLECTESGYAVHHDGVETALGAGLGAGPGAGRVGVFLDYPAGELSFYQVADGSVVLLHKVQTTFTQPLHPGIGLTYQWYDIGVFAELVDLS